MSRKERHALIARVLEIQAEYYALWGKFPTVDEVAREVGLDLDRETRALVPVSSGGSAL